MNNTIIKDKMQSEINFELQSLVLQLSYDVINLRNELADVKRKLNLHQEDIFKISSVIDENF